MGIRVVAVLVSLILAGCGFAADTEVVSMPEMTAADLAECRRLGGKAVYVEYRREDASTRTIVQGVPRGPAGFGAEMELQVESRATKQAMRRNGWHKAAVSDLLSLSDDNEMARNFGEEGTDAELDARRRRVQDKLDQMPSCLEQARRAEPTEG